MPEGRLATGAPGNTGDNLSGFACFIVAADVA